MSARPVTLTALLAIVVLSIAACSPSAGALGTPRSPDVTPATSDGATPSDVAPGPSAPAASPTPTQPPSNGPTASAEPGTASPAPTPSPSPTPAATTIVRAYFMLGSFTGNDGLAPVLREIPQTKAVARAAMLQLLEGPQGAELRASPAFYSSIPQGTRLIDLSVANGVATVVLSSEFTAADANFQATTARAQVVYTLTQFSTIDEVRIGVEGKDPEPASTRADYQSMALPAIFVDRPAWGAAAGNPAAVSGLANVFEATFRVQIVDGKGSVLADKQVMASCGTGCWGSFKTSVAYTVTKAQYGTLRVFDYSAKDGKPENVTEYRVWLTPGS